ncbi:MAG: RsmE family RNA methyltransferase [Armatimonadota bacterium]
MAHHRFYYDNTFSVGAIITIDGELFHRITNVLRLTIDDNITLFNSQSIEVNAKIVFIKSKALDIEITSFVESSIESNISISIACAWLKSDKNELVCQKCTELGAARIAYFTSDRCVSKLKNDAAIKKHDRLAKIAQEAAEQSKRTKVPKIIIYSDLDDMLSQIEKDILCVACFENENNLTFKTVLKEYSPDRLMIIIGPEGGFTESEIEKFRKNSIKIVSIGKRILRSETSAISACAAAFYELES